MLTPYLARVFLIWLTLSVAVETLALYAVVRRLFRLPPEELPARYILSGAVTATACTYPYLWFLAPVYIPDYAMRHLVAEPLIIVIESIILYAALRVGWRRALVASLLANLISILIGIPLNRAVIAMGWVH